MTPATPRRARKAKAPRYLVTRKMIARCAEAVWCADYPAMLWPSASDSERARCIKAAQAVLRCVHVVVREVGK